MSQKRGNVLWTGLSCGIISEKSVIFILSPEEIPDWD